MSLLPIAYLVIGKTLIGSSPRFRLHSSAAIAARAHDCGVSRMRLPRVVPARFPFADADAAHAVDVRRTADAVVDENARLEVHADRMSLIEAGFQRKFSSTCSSSLADSRVTSALAGGEANAETPAGFDGNVPTHPTSSRYCVAPYAGLYQ
jgi:hypothetical protein